MKERDWLSLSASIEDHGRVMAIRKEKGFKTVRETVAYILNVFDGKVVR